MPGFRRVATAYFLSQATEASYLLAVVAQTNDLIVCRIQAMMSRVKKAIVATTLSELRVGPMIELPPRFSVRCTCAATSPVTAEASRSAASLDVRLPVPVPRIAWRNYPPAYPGKHSSAV